MSQIESRAKIRSRGEGPEEELGVSMVERIPSNPFFILEIRFLEWEREGLNLWIRLKGR